MKKFIYVIVLVVLFACNQTNNNQRLEYYESGELKSRGTYLYDSIPYDTLFTYYKNGNLESKIMYDKDGRKNGESRFFYETSVIRQVQNYINDTIDGFVYSYSATGKLVTKSYFKRENKVGDTEFFNDSTGDLELYNFFDFSSRNNIVREYDGKKVTKALGNDFIIDSVLNVKDTLIDSDYLVIELLIAHVPYTRVQVNAMVVDCRKTIISEVNLAADKTWQVLKFPITNEVCEVWIKGTQYDSLRQKYDYMMLKHVLK